MKSKHAWPQEPAHLVNPRWSARPSRRSARTTANSWRPRRRWRPCRRKLPVSRAKCLIPSVPCRLRAREFLREHLAGKVSFLNASNERLTSLIQSKYVEVAESLLREFRIFCAANALVFVFLGVVAFVKRQAGIQLLAPAFVLVVSAVVVACLYLFTQNWLQTVLLGQYVGFWYFPYLGLAVASLGDVLFNRARVTSAIVNAALSAVGGVASAVPC
jgi:hypothetical protein